MLTLALLPLPGKVQKKIVLPQGYILVLLSKGVFLAVCGVFCGLEC